MGDSGSGFYVRHGDVWFIEGITSSSLVKDGDCDVTKNAVFTRLSNFTDWINENTGSGIPTSIQTDLKLQSNLNHNTMRVQVNPTKTVPSIDDMWKSVKSFGGWIG